MSTVKSTWNKGKVGWNTFPTLHVCHNGKSTLCPPPFFFLSVFWRMHATCIDSWLRESLCGILGREGDIHPAILERLLPLAIVCILESFRVDQEAPMTLNWKMMDFWVSYHAWIKGQRKDLQVDIPNCTSNPRVAEEVISSCRVDHLLVKFDSYYILMFILLLYYTKFFEVFDPQWWTHDLMDGKLSEICVERDCQEQIMYLPVFVHWARYDLGMSSSIAWSAWLDVVAPSVRCRQEIMFNHSNTQLTDGLSN